MPKLYKGVRVESLEDGEGRYGWLRATMSHKVRKNGVMGSQYFTCVIPAKFGTIARQAKFDETTIKITTDGAKTGETVTAVEHESSPFSRVLDVLNDHVQQAGTFVAGRNKVYKFVIRSTGVVLFIEKVRGGGVEVFAPLTRTNDMKELLRALNKEIDDGTAAEKAASDDPSATLDMILISGLLGEDRAQYRAEEDFRAFIESTKETVTSWTPEERQAVESYCGAVHMAASDNDGVEVPPLPDVLKTLIESVRV